MPNFVSLGVRFKKNFTSLMLVHLLDKLIASKLIEVSNGDEVTSPSQVVQMSKKNEHKE